MRIARFKKLTLLLVLVLILLSFSCSESSDSTSFRFVFMTDIHVQPERGGVEGFKAAIAKVHSLKPKPEFVITGGDLIMDALGQRFERADSLYNLYGETCKLFEMPVYNTIGNHEIFGIYPKSHVEPSHPEYGKIMFSKRLGEGETYRSFDHGNWHFILLDALEITPERKYIGRVDSTQLAWLKRDLEKTGTERPIVIVTHMPFYTIFQQYKRGPTTPNGEGLVLTNAHEISKLCENYNLKIVLQGHLHTVEDIHYRGVHYIIGGAVSGGWWKGSHEGFPEGFAVIDAKGDSFTWEYVTFGWNAEIYNK